jgi:hypothetical protein
MVQAQASLALDDQLAAGWFGWMRNKGILKLNAILCLSLISSYATGYDGSKLIPIILYWKSSNDYRYDERTSKSGYMENLIQRSRCPETRHVSKAFNKHDRLYRN